LLTCNRQYCSPMARRVLSLVASRLQSNRSILNVLAFALLIILIALAIWLSVDQLDHPSIRRSDVAGDCVPHYHDQLLEHLDAQLCQQLGCSWQPEAPAGAPKCQIPADHTGYSVDFRNDAGQATLTYDGEEFYGPAVEPLAVNLSVVDDNIFRITIYDPNEKRFQIPDSLLRLPAGRIGKLETDCCRMELCKNPFGVRLVRKSTGRALFDSCNTQDFYFADQFLQISTRTASDNVYGFGEHTAHRLRRDMNWTRWPMWSRDEGLYNHGWNLYGVQPFYICLEDADGNANGVMLANSNAMEVWLQPTPAVTWRTVGGVLDFYIFAGPSPKNVVEQLTSVVGRPAMPPYWSLGFQLSRWGYRGTSQIWNLVDRMAEYRIPHDVQWGDIDYMYKKYAFTYNNCSSSWVDLPTMVDKLKQRHIRFVPIVDPCIKTSEYFLDSDSSDEKQEPCKAIPYYPYLDAIDKRTFVEDADDLFGYYLGNVWPGQCHYPDFTHPNISEYWFNAIANFHRSINFDGLWIDMNEASNFNDADNYNNSYAQHCRNDSFNWPEYIPRVKDFDVAGLYGKTMCMEAKMYAGMHYNLHSLYGHAMSIATREALQKLQPDKRPFILTRSNFLGTASHAFHWLGDNQAHWEQLHWSIVGMLEYNLFGFNMVGSDICGFVFNTTESLCRRWTQLGAFYPFSRNHNIIGTVDQDPASFGPEFAAMARRILLERYRLLPYLYTLMYESHVYGTPVVRALFVEFPTDKGTWDVDDQFLWGASLLVSPILENKAVKRLVYYPAGRWFDYFNYEPRPNHNGAMQVEVGCDADSIIVDLRGGSVLPTQIPDLNTELSRRNSMQLLVVLSDAYDAAGTLFHDDGSSPTEQGSFLYMRMLVTSEIGQDDTVFSMNFVCLHQGYNTTVAVDELQLVGLPGRLIGATLDGTPLNYTASANVPAHRQTIFNFTISLHNLCEVQFQWFTANS
ncbi:Sucrase-isomaltase, intestinal, partial [Trichinella patagoniensis]